MDKSVEKLVIELADRLLANSLRLATAESCTGGWLSAELTAVAGSSQWYEGGVVSYSNAMKQRQLQVPEALIRRYGAVSESVALAMSKGVREILQTQMSVAITGIAGPDGGSIDKPVGAVWIAWSMGSDNFASEYQFTGDRREIRRQAVSEALQGLLKLLE